MSDASTTHKVDDIVMVEGDRWLGLTWKVVKVNPTTYSLKRVDADGILIPDERGLRAAHQLVHTPAKPGDPVGQPYQPITLYSPGQFVRYNGRKTIAGLSTGDIAVITRDDGRNRVHLAKPGGHQDQEITMDRRGVEAVDTAVAIADLAGQPANALVSEPERPALVQVPVPGQPATAGILKGWLRDVPDSMPVLISRDDTGNTHAGLAGHTGALAVTEGRLGFQTVLWDGARQDVDLLDLMQAEGGQRALVLIPQV